MSVVAGVEEFRTLEGWSVSLSILSNRRSLFYLDYNGVQVGHGGPDQGRQGQQRKLHVDIGRADLLYTAYIGVASENGGGLRESVLSK